MPSDRLKDDRPCCLKVGETTFLSGSLKGTADLISRTGDFDFRGLSHEELSTLYEAGRWHEIDVPRLREQIRLGEVGYVLFRSHSLIHVDLGEFGVRGTASSTTGWQRTLLVSCYLRLIRKSYGDLRRLPPELLEHVLDLKEMVVYGTSFGIVSDVFELFSTTPIRRASLGSEGPRVFSFPKPDDRLSWSVQWNLVADVYLALRSLWDLFPSPDGPPFEVGVFSVRDGIVSRYTLNGSEVTEADAPILVTGVGVNAPDIIPRLEDWCRLQP